MISCARALEAREGAGAAYRPIRSRTPYSESIAAHHDYDWQEAEEQFRQRRAPPKQAHPNVHFLLHDVLFAGTGTFRRLRFAEIAKAITAQDPLNSFWRARQSWVYCDAGRHEEAIAEAQKALEFDSTNYQARMIIALSYTFQGNWRLGQEEAEEAIHGIPVRRVEHRAAGRNLSGTRR